MYTGGDRNGLRASAVGPGSPFTCQLHTNHRRSLRARCEPSMHRPSPESLSLHVRSGGLHTSQSRRAGLLTLEGPGLHVCTAVALLTATHDGQAFSVFASLFQRGHLSEPLDGSVGTGASRTAHPWLSGVPGQASANSCVSAKDESGGSKNTLPVICRAKRVACVHVLTDQGTWLRLLCWFLSRGCDNHRGNTLAGTTQFLLKCICVHST